MPYSKNELSLLVKWNDSRKIANFIQYLVTANFSKFISRTDGGVQSKTSESKLLWDGLEFPNIILQEGFRYIEDGF